MAFFSRAGLAHTDGEQRPRAVFQRGRVIEQLRRGGVFLRSRKSFNLRRLFPPQHRDDLRAEGDGLAQRFYPLAQELPLLAAVRAV